VRSLNQRQAILILNASTADFDAELPHNLTLPNLTNNIVFQHGAPDDLKVLSWTKNTPHAPNFYAYDDDPIFEGQTIYLIDRGLDASSEVSCQGWIFFNRTIRRTNVSSP